MWPESIFLENWIPIYKRLPTPALELKEPAVYICTLTARWKCTVHNFKYLANTTLTAVSYIKIKIMKYYFESIRRSYDK